MVLAGLLVLILIGISPAFDERSNGGVEMASGLSSESLSGLDGEEGDANVPLAGIKQEINPLHQNRIVAAAPIALLASDTGSTALAAIDCLTAAVYYEAGYELRQGQRAVAQVVLNRVKHPAFPDSVCGVVFEGSHRSSGCQFTFACDGSLSRAPGEDSWQRARAVAKAALSGFVEPSIGHATHYHATYMQPYWEKSLLKLNVVGSHAFYLWPGAAGMPTAFSKRYDANEVIPSNARILLSRHLLSASADLPRNSANPELSLLIASEIEAETPERALPDLISAAHRPESGSVLIVKKTQLIPSQARLKPYLLSGDEASPESSNEEVAE
ncbi:cell wall hydrolase [Qipengyuania aquimaris]|nr:cell wall hydrolase [Qipengyuania aquimaris]